MESGVAFLGKAQLLKESEAGFVFAVDQGHQVQGGMLCPGGVYQHAI